MTRPSVPGPPPFPWVEASGWLAWAAAVVAPVVVRDRLSCPQALLASAACALAFAVLFRDDWRTVFGPAIMQVAVAVLRREGNRRAIPDPPAASADGELVSTVAGKPA
jgi:hypothetical protein